MSGRRGRGALGTYDPVARAEARRERDRPAKFCDTCRKPLYRARRDATAAALDYSTIHGKRYRVYPHTQGRKVIGWHITTRPLNAPAT